jgi:hypothetical protein
MMKKRLNGSELLFKIRPGWTNTGERFADKIQKSAEPGGDLHRVANQVSGFFGSFFKEVKETTNEIIKDIKGSPPPGSPRSQRSTPATSPFKTNAAASEEQRLAREEREKYELELAIAMSLSETGQEKNIGDIDSFSPTKPMAEMHVNGEDSDDEKLVRSAKKSEPEEPSGSESK